MWDGKSVDEIRWLREAIKMDELQLECAPLGPIQKKRLQEKIDRQRAKLKELLRKKREEKARKKASK